MHYLSPHVVSNRKIHQVNHELFPYVLLVDLETNQGQIIPYPQRQHIEDVVQVKWFADKWQSRELERYLSYENKRGIPYDQKPHFLQSLNAIIIYHLLAIAHIGYDKDANDDLEAPVDDIFVWKDYDHKENGEGKQNQKLFFHVL